MTVFIWGLLYVKKQNTQEITFTSEGYYMLPVFDNCECMIFPSKDQRDWSKFQIPFKDGDVVITTSNAICIYKSIHQAYKSKNFIDFYCVYRSSDNLLVIKDNYDSHCGPVSEAKLATEEEKQRLFDAIKENGYKWNHETETLDRLVEPKFKVGDRIKHKEGYFSGVVTEFDGKYFKIKYDDATENIVNIKYQDDWELVLSKFDISTLKPFESRVLVRDCKSHKWGPAIWGLKPDDTDYLYIVVGGISYCQCIPYEGNEHLLGTTDDCDEYYKTWK